MNKISVIILLLLAFATTGCSIKQAVMNELSGTLGKADVSTVITGEEDPELLEAALPSFLKLYEIILKIEPDNRGLLLSTSNAFALYAYAFVQTPATMLEQDQFSTREQMMKRAKKLFLRSLGYAVHAITIKYPAFDLSLKEAELEKVLAPMTKDDVSYLYYAGLSAMGAFTSDNFDMELMVLLPKVVLLLSRALALDETFESGAIHEFFLQYYGSLPRDLGGSEEKARAHYAKAVEYSRGAKAGTHLALASSVSVNAQNEKEFRELIAKTLAVDVDAVPSGRLMNIIAQRKARWMLDHIDDYFLVGDTQ